METSEVGQSRRIAFDGAYNNKTVKIMQKVAPSFEVTIQVVAKEGKPYTFTSKHPQTGKTETMTSVVPNNYSYIRVSKENAVELNGFWEAVKTEQAKQSPTNPPPKKSNHSFQPTLLKSFLQILNKFFCLIAHPTRW